MVGPVKYRITAYAPAVAAAPSEPTPRSHDFSRAQAWSFGEGLPPRAQLSRLALGIAALAVHEGREAWEGEEDDDD